MVKIKHKKLLEGSRKEVLMRKVNYIKLNRSVNNSSISDITSWYEKRIKMLINCKESLTENNDSLAKSLADQKAISQSWYSECVSLKVKLLENHERLVSYQKSDACEPQKAAIKETERGIAAIMSQIKEVLKSGIDSAVGLVDNLNNVMTMAESLPKQEELEGSSSSLNTEPTEISNFFTDNTGIPLINRGSMNGTSSLSSEGIISHEKMLEIAKIRRAARFRANELLFNDMSVIKESESEESSEDEHEQVADAFTNDMDDKKASPEIDVMPNLRRSKRLTKMTDYRQQMNELSDSDEEAEIDLSTICNMDLSSSISTISDFENYKRSGSFVSKRSRKNNSCNQLNSKDAEMDVLFLSMDSAFGDEKTVSNASLESCNKAILITPSPFNENVPSTALDESKPCEEIINTSMEFTSYCSEPSTNKTSPLHNTSIDNIPEETENKWFKRNSCGKLPEITTSAKTLYDSTMMDVSPASFHYKSEGSLILTENLDQKNIIQLRDKIEDFPSIAKNIVDEGNKENSPAIDLIGKTRKSSRITKSLSQYMASPAIKPIRNSKKTSRVAEFISLRSDSPLKPSLSLMNDPVVAQLTTDLDPPLKIKVEPVSSVCSIPSLKVNELQVNHTEYIEKVSEDVHQIRRRRCVTPISYIEPRVNGKYRQVDGSSIYSDGMLEKKSKKGRRKQ